MSIGVDPVVGMATQHDAQSVLRELGLVRITLRLHLRLFSEGLQNQ